MQLMGFGQLDRLPVEPQVAQPVLLRLRAWILHFPHLLEWDQQEVEPSCFGMGRIQCLLGQGDLKGHFP